MQNVAHYNLLERIGEGGIGEVFRARDTKVGRTVALKVVASEIAQDPRRLTKLLHDARAASALSHPNIATLFDVGEADGVHYLAYEFAAGRTLRDEAGGASLPPRRAVDLAVQMADGVATGHAHGIVHGDLRPDTVIVTAKGSAKILDFGFSRWSKSAIVRARAAVASAGLATEGLSVAAYMSPEQALGRGADARSDVFTLGTLTYEMLTGRNPFAAPTVASTMTNVIRAAAPLASEVNPSV